MAKQRYTAQQVIEAIKKIGPVKAKIAEHLICDRHTIDNYIERYPTVKQAFEDQRQSVVDMGEAQFIVKIKEGFWPAIRLCLLTLGKDRGYVQKQEIGADVRIREWPKFVVDQGERRSGDDPASGSASDNGEQGPLPGDDNGDGRG